MKKSDTAPGSKKPAMDLAALMALAGQLDGLKQREDDAKRREDDAKRREDDARREAATAGKRVSFLNKEEVRTKKEITQLERSLEQRERRVIALTSNDPVQQDWARREYQREQNRTVAVGGPAGGK